MHHYSEMGDSTNNEYIELAPFPFRYGICVNFDQSDDGDATSSA